MDIFNSALKNPVPPIKRESEETSGGEDVAVPDALDDRGEEDSKSRRKKNSRRKHRNSHLGCGTCKKRRIKCDENLPSCLNCLKGKLHCAYLNLDGPARNALRVAQYHQNLRQGKNHQDSNDESKTGKPMGGMAGEEHGNMNANVNANPMSMNNVQAAQNSTTGESVMTQFSGPSNPNSQAFAVHYPLMQSAAIAVPTQQQTAHIIQSPYGPLVSLQPMATFPAYSQVPVQGIPQQMPHIIYPPHTGMPQPPPPPPPHVGQQPIPPPPVPQLQNHSPSMTSDHPTGAIPLQNSISNDSKSDEVQLAPRNKNLHPPSQPSSMGASPIMPHSLTSRSSSSLTLPSVNTSTQDSSRINTEQNSARGFRPNSVRDIEKEDAEGEKNSKSRESSGFERSGTESSDKIPKISKLLS